MIVLTVTPKVLIVLSHEECEELWSFLQHHVIPLGEYPHVHELLDRIQLRRLSEPEPPTSNSTH